MTETPISPRATEFAPSAVRAEEPSFARLVGVVGLLPLVLGTVTIVSSQYREPWLPVGMAYLFAAFGIACLLFHAVRDEEREFRRAYGAAAAVLLLVGLTLFVLPGRPEATDAAKKLTYYLLPWAAGAAFLGLLFLVPFVRHETDAKLRDFGLGTLFVVGGGFAGGAVVAGFADPATLVPKGLVLGILGLMFLTAYLTQVNTDDGPGRLAAVGLGVAGALTVAAAFGWAAFPTVLFEGPQALKTPFQTADKWKFGLRIAVILACLGAGFFAFRAKTWAGWVRAGVGIVGLVFALVFFAGTVANPVTAVPKPFLVPYGLVLGGLGLLYLLTSLGAVSDSPFVVLCRRELASLFYSPIAYIVLLGAAFSGWLGYWWFVTDLVGGRRAMLEPVLQNNPGLLLVPALVSPLLVPAITMRLFSEEKRTGSLEVLLTAPVSEWPIVLSKFFAGWFMYMLSFVPAGLYLVALRAEGGTPFDYRPLLSYYAAVGATGAAFVGMGLFFSSLTKNQIIAAVMTSAGMMFLLLCITFRRFQVVPGFDGVFGRFDYLTLWGQALGGQLPLVNVIVFASLAVFWVFLTVKAVEARKWG